MSEVEESPVVDLLRRARGGDDVARDELFEKCRSYVAIVARTRLESWLRAKADASDLVQQTLLEAHRGLDRFRGATEAEWLAWLRQILNHNAADLIRRNRATGERRGRREIPLDSPGGDSSRRYIREPSDPGESPSQLVLRREREIEVADAVAQLPQDYQDVIQLRNLQRLPFDEVAARMGRSRPATQMLWMRALRKLEEVLADRSLPKA
ncbi:MAG: sigma-70 family RNA polymerase sigma factor [Planctomycetaceae bacterium]